MLIKRAQVIQSLNLDSGSFASCPHTDIDCTRMNNSYFKSVDYSQALKMAHFLLIIEIGDLQHKQKSIMR
jgi:hypothetical protein